MEICHLQPSLFAAVSFFLLLNFEKNNDSSEVFPMLSCRLPIAILLAKVKESRLGACKHSSQVTLEYRAMPHFKGRVSSVVPISTQEPLISTFFLESILCMQGFCLVSVPTNTWPFWLSLPLLLSVTGSGHTAHQSRMIEIHPFLSLLSQKRKSRQSEQMRPLAYAKNQHLNLSGAAVSWFRKTTKHYLHDRLSKVLRAPVTKPRLHCGWNETFVSNGIISIISGLSRKRTGCYPTSISLARANCTHSDTQSAYGRSVSREKPSKTLPRIPRFLCLAPRPLSLH